MRRLARFGTGWIPWGPAADVADALVDTIPRLREAVGAFGRDPAGVQIAGKVPLVTDKVGKPAVGPSMAGVPRLVEAGVTDVRLQLSLPDELAAAEDVLAAWVGEFRAVSA
jgi:hypothetical protein